MDRRTVWAILLMMVIAVAPAIFIKRSPRPTPAAAGDSTATDTASAARAPVPPAESAHAVAPATPTAADTLRSARDTAAPAAGSTVSVTSPLYTYGISTNGGRLVEARLERYRSMAPADNGGIAEILPPGSELLGLTIVAGRDTVPLARLPFTVSDTALTAGGGPLRLHASRGPVTVDLSYTFVPDDYRITVEGRVQGIGPNGGTLLVGMGPTLANTEANLTENHRALALVTHQNDADRIDFAGLDAGETRTVSGPLDWAAVKSKYFVTGLLAWDSTGGHISGATITPRPTPEKHPTEADVHVSLPVPPTGQFSYTLYAGPMEYDRLARLGRGFDDVNPYGWPGFRTVIRPVAVGVRWLLVWMHENLHLAYGLVLVFFGIMVRVLLWPLNQKAMRANMQLQAVQPLMKDIQERHKGDPQKMQQEMFKLYKEYNVNPLGGCWPMLLPMPVLFALFFVFQNTIELRGASFLWLPDLARPDPLYIIPVVMGLSMYGLSKVGQIGMEPNPQMKMMLYVMPVMMTFLFLNFASGLNLYYAVSNIASIPQQWMLARERVKRNAGATVVSTKPSPAPAVAGKGKRRKG